MYNKVEKISIAALGDLHVGEHDHHDFKALFAEISAKAEILILCGDLTHGGLPDEASILAESLSVCSIPVFAVLGNHDHENNLQGEIRRILSAAKVAFLDEKAEIVKNCGFAGVKGFGGGFGAHMFPSFGEETLKKFVAESVNESLHLENLLRSLSTPKNIAVLHYAPVTETLKGEPLELFAVLGSSRLGETISRFKVNAIFHGHAHYGTMAATFNGIPVYNCASSVLQKNHLQYLSVKI